MKLCVFMAILLIYINLKRPLSLAIPIHSEQIEKLIKYGYLDRSKEINSAEILKAINLYEKFYRIQDHVDDDNIAYKLQLIDKIDKDKSRCVLSDFFRDQDKDPLNYVDNEADQIRVLSFSSDQKLKSSFQSIKKEFQNELIKYQMVSWWPKLNLKWTLINRPLHMSFKITKNIFSTAFYVWSLHSQLEFQYVPWFVADTNDQPDLIIDFQIQDNHDRNCEYKFASSTLAHAFYPVKGIAHFELGKSWSLNAKESKKFNLLAVAIHEIGHLLGMGHSNNPSSIMFPDYNMNEPNFNFNRDDIELLQHIYGKRQ